MKQFNAIDVLVEIAFIVSANFNYQIGKKNQLTKSCFDETLFIVENQYDMFKNNIKDDGYHDILKKIIIHPWSPVILGLLDSIFKTAEKGPNSLISKLVYKDYKSAYPENRSLFFVNKSLVLEMIENVIMESENYMLEFYTV